MAHELDTKRDGSAAIFTVGQSPWHRLGADLTAAPTVDEALVLAGADFKVGFEAVHAASGAWIDGARAVVRQDTGRPLGIVRKRYTPLQNVDAFNVLRPLVESGKAWLETGGVLRAGADVWILARFEAESGPIDQFLKEQGIDPFFLLANNHSGRRGVMCSLTPIRVVCANTLGMAESRARRGLSRSFSVSHTANVESRVREAAEQLMRDVLTRLAEAVGQYARMQAALLREEAWKTIVLDGVAKLPVPPSARQAETLYEVALARANQRRGRLTWLWRFGPGHKDEGTVWEAYQAVTHSVDHDQSLWAPKAAPDGRLASLADGHLGKVKQTLLDQLYRYAVSN